MKPRRVKVEGLARLPAFSHAVVAGDFICFSGTLGVKPNSTSFIKLSLQTQNHIIYCWAAKKNRSMNEIKSEFTENFIIANEIPRKDFKGWAVSQGMLLQ